MRLNLILRTYEVQNLYYSLFDIPNKIESDKIECYVHNDNPKQAVLFDLILQEFQTQFPEYKVIKIQEEENQHMFMSSLNTIPYLNDRNNWTMILDDDDRLLKFDQHTFDCINKYSLNHQLAYNYQFNEYETKYYSEYSHCITPTKSLKKLYKYKPEIKNLLIKHVGTTKFSYCEDFLLRRLVKILDNLYNKNINKVLIVHNSYPHECNNYKSGNNHNGKFYLQGFGYIYNIIQEFKNCIKQCK